MGVELGSQELQLAAGLFFFHGIHVLAEPDLFEGQPDGDRAHRPYKDVYKAFPEYSSKGSCLGAWTEDVCLQPDSQRGTKRGAKTDRSRQETRKGQEFL